MRASIRSGLSSEHARLLEQKKRPFTCLHNSSISLSLSLSLSLDATVNILELLPPPPYVQFGPTLKLFSHRAFLLFFGGKEGETGIIAHHECKEKSTETCYYESFSDGFSGRVFNERIEAKEMVPQR